MFFKSKLLLSSIVVTFLVGCGGGGGGGGGESYSPAVDDTPPAVDTPVVDDTPPAVDTPVVDDTPAFAVTSENYTEGGAIPLLQACTAQGGTDASPQFSWTNPPVDTAKYALIMDDETAPCGTGSLACVHWALFNSPSSTTALATDVDISTIDGAVEGNTYIPTTDYEGPCPPSAHTYKTTLYALDSSMMSIPVDSATFTRSDFELAYEGNILGQAEIMGTFTPSASSPQETISVTVAANSNGSGNVYVIDGEQKRTLTLNSGTSYTFTHPTGHPLRFSTTADGTHGGGTEFTTGVDTSASGTTVIDVTSSSPVTLYYYCSIHAGMGGVATNSGGQASGY